MIELERSVAQGIQTGSLLLRGFLYPVYINVDLPALKSFTSKGGSFANYSKVDVEGIYG